MPRVGAYFPAPTTTSSTMMVVLLWCSLASSFATPLATPKELAGSVTSKIVEGGATSVAFSRWSYGCGIILDGIMEVAERGMFDDSTMTKSLNWTNKVLTGFATNPLDNAYKVVNGETIPWGYSIGDVIGLFPMSYLHRAALYSNQSATGAVDPRVFPSEPAGWNRSQDEFIAHQVANQYILGWPTKWTDGTVTRDTPGHWPEEEKLPKAHQFVWGDDAFMGLTLVSRLLTTDQNAGLLTKSERKSYTTLVAQQSKLFVQHLADDTSVGGSGEANDGLYYHGRNAQNGDLACCKWGRANGWNVMSAVETLTALEKEAHPSFPQMKTAFVAHLRALAKVQNKTDGRWHQLLNDTTSYLETSITSMTLFGVLRGVLNGWLDKVEWSDLIDSAWKGLASTVAADGTVSGICDGFGIHATAADYKVASTAYLGSAPGLGSVLRAAAAYSDFLAKYSQQQ